MKLSTFKDIKQHCLKQKACHTCIRAGECFDLFGKYKPKDFAVSGDKIKRVINNTK